MPCLCSANTLRLFIRSVAQIDVSTTVPRYPTQLRKGALRNFTTTRTVALQSSLSWKTVSTSALSLSPTENSNAETPTRPDVDSTGQQLSNNHTFDLNSAVLEISPETIDALAAESRFTAPRSYGEFQSDESDGYTWRIERGEGSARSGPIKPTFRRTKVQNTSLAIHFDNPRAPVLKPPTTYSQAPLLNRRDNRPDYKEYRQGLKGSRPEYGEREYSKPERSQPKDDWTPPSREDWMMQKAALKDKIEGGWNPMKRLSPDALAGIRALHAQMPEIYTTATLAENFKISPEAIRRILKSKWVPKQEEEIDRSKRWFKRGEKVWDRWAEQGKKPPKQWRQYGRGQWKMVVRGGKERKQWVPASSTSGSSGFSRRSENTATTKSPDYPVTTRRSDFPVTAKADTIPWG